MKERIKAFLSSDKKYLTIDVSESNDIYYWYKLRNPIITFYHYLIMKIGNILPSLKLKNYFYRLFLSMTIGEKTGIAPCTIDPFFPELIRIDENTIIGWKVQILTHEFLQDEIRIGRVDIGKNVTVGAFSKIRSGVSIGDGAIIAMNSYVNKDVPPNELWGGIPARKIKDLDD